MVVGNGMLAKLFSKYVDDCNIFIIASGVSNSKEIRNTEFNREFNLVKDIVIRNQDKTIVYFSTSNMYDPFQQGDLYVKHKLTIEQYIAKHAKQFHIFRISQIIGKANNNTLINFLISKILSNQSFEVWVSATRNLIAIEDVNKIISYIIDNKIYMNQIINIANSQNISILSLIDIVEGVLAKRASCHYVDKGFPFEQIDITPIKDICKDLAINFDMPNYYQSAIRSILE